MFLDRIHILLRKPVFLYFTCFIVILTVSLYPRLWNLRNLPPIIVDEPADLRDIEKIIQTGTFPITNFHWDFSKSFLGYAPVIFLIRILRMNPDLYTLRLTSVILSITTLFVFFVLLKIFSNNFISLGITLLLSASYYFLQFSRVGWVNLVFVTAVGLLMLYFSEITIRKKSIVSCLIAGLLAGILFYSYRSGTIYIAGALVLFIFSPIFMKITLKQALVYTVSFIIMFFITAFPWINKIRQNQTDFNMRLRAVSIETVNLPYYGLTDKKDIYLYQTTQAIKAWIFLEAVPAEGHESQRYLPLRLPPVNILIRLGFWLGLIIAFFRFNRMYHWLFIYFAGIVSGQILTIDPPNGARGLILLPIIYLFVSLSVNLVYNYTKRNFLFTIIFAIIVIIFSLLDFHTYQYWMSWIKV